MTDVDARVLARELREISGRLSKWTTQDAAFAELDRFIERLSALEREPVTAEEVLAAMKEAHEMARPPMPDLVRSRLFSQRIAAALNRAKHGEQK